MGVSIDGVVIIWVVKTLIYLMFIVLLNFCCLNFSELFSCLVIISFVELIINWFKIKELILKGESDVKMKKDLNERE